MEDKELNEAMDDMCDDLGGRQPIDPPIYVGTAAALLRTVIDSVRIYEKYYGGRVRVLMPSTEDAIEKLLTQEADWSWRG